MVCSHWWLSYTSLFTPSPHAECGLTTGICHAHFTVLHHILCRCMQWILFAASRSAVSWIKTTRAFLPQCCNCNPATFHHVNPGGQASWHPFSRHFPNQRKETHRDCQGTLRQGCGTRGPRCSGGAHTNCWSMRTLSSWVASREPPLESLSPPNCCNHL